ncbi:MAG: hypothetical protein A3G44_07880 [Candidatus Rokubacteria bacterium RIFCSPLOWO2_12_FULL_73_47]|nr:MAG: hypothetical protein A3G44_07880 [Candidatus Rokubacteria bacterium RIFCSPLOWO2_12_FULL_73_47]
MTCHDARKLFSALLDEALAADERRALDAHLAGCAECRRERERFHGTVALVRGLEPARAPAGFVDRVLAAARPLPRWRRFARALVFPLPVKLPLEAAAIVLVGVIVGLVYRQTPELRQAARVDEVTAPRVVAEPPAARAPAVATEAPVRLGADARRDEPAARARQEGTGVTAPAAEPERAAAPPAARSYAAPAAPPAPVPAPARSEPELGAAAKSAPAEPAAKPRDKGDAKEETERDASADRFRAKRAPGPAERRALVEPAAPPYVSGRLAAAERDAAERAILALVERAGGARLSRRADAEGVVLEVVLPRAAWPALARELRHLGRWEPTREPAALPDPVRVTVHIVG